MGRETIQRGRQTIGAPKKEDNNKRGTLADLATGALAGLAVAGITAAVMGDSQPVTSNGERAAEAYLIDKVRAQIVDMKDRLVNLSGYNTTIQNKGMCISLLTQIQNIVNQIGLTTAVNHVIFDIHHITNKQLYTWKIKITPQTSGGIRRESDPLKAELLTAPEFDKNPIRNVSVSTSFPITYVLAEVEWRYL